VGRQPAEEGSTTRTRSILLGVGTSLVLVLSACGSSPPAGLAGSSSGGSNGGGPVGPGLVAVTRGTAVSTVKETDDLTFVPATVNVKVGDIVHFTNSGTIPHNVTFIYAGIASQTMNGGDSFLVKFTSPGTYKYVCTFHAPGMAGTITVG
jgi:plastocyanin